MNDCPDRFVPGGVMDRISRVMARIENSLILTALGAMTAVTFVQVVMRFVLNSPFMWGEELARYLSAYATYLGIAYAARRDSHIKVTFFTDRLPPGARPYKDFLTNLICMAICFYLFFNAYDLMDTQHGIRSTSLDAPMSLVFLPMVLGVLLAGIRYLMRNILLARKIMGGTEA